MRRANVFTAEPPYDPGDPPGFRAGDLRLHPLIGGSLMAGRLYELPPGESNCPYHFEYGDEEWLIVLAGRPTVRHPDGEDELEPGDVVCFPPGPDGAHRITNRGEVPVRMLIVSTRHDPAIAVYPDSDKVGIFNADPPLRLVLPRSAAVGYFEGE